MGTRRSLILLVVTALLTCSGCWFGTGSTSDIRYEFTRQTGVELEPEFGIKLGRITTGLGRCFVRGSEPDIPKLKGVNKVEVGVYTVSNRADADRVRMDYLDLPGWMPLVRVRENGEDVSVLVQPEGDRIPAMLVLVHDHDEFVVVRLRGKLHKFLKANLSEVLDGLADLNESLTEM